MEVILAEYCGFCYGVRRAVNLALNTKKEGQDREVYTLGPIIHNPQMVAHLAEQGIGVVDKIEDAPENATIIIRSHGVGPEIYEKAKELDIEIVDATCPHVKKAQMAAHELVERGCQIVILGEAHHPEVQSIFLWTNQQAIIVETLEDAEKLPYVDKIGVVAQTTFSSKEFDEIVEVVKTKCKHIRIQRTICTATDNRQKAALDLAQKVDVMIVVGGKNSANTTRLAKTCENIGCRAYHIETDDELVRSWFDGVSKIGITAGASTPDWLIDDVYKKLLTL
ncbi:4-hydroxy-3-methylbut-2-enyl diphosphate reductase [Selenomonadales bacterium OttesenSCG-928-I06]|nr:4-hydroxy-3-methylbut-2-enyl diphosphate reductase [Selenomonadales bacterium OttesenSCG-928-I06]